MTLAAFARLALAAVPLAVTLALLLRYRFELQVGLRYLSRPAPPGARPKLALVVALILCALGAVLLFSSVDRGWLVYLGAVLVFTGGFAALGAALLLRFSVFTTVSAMGLAIGVAALLVVLAVTGGFRRDFLERVTAFHGHLVVGLYGEPSVDEARAEIAELRRKLADLPGLVGTGPFAVSFAEVSIGPASASLKALDPAAGTPSLARWMVEGDLAALARPASCGGARDEFVGHLVLGRPLARRLRAKVGDCVQVVIPFGRPAELQPVALTFAVVGIFEMGFHQHDTRLAYVAFEDLRALERARPFIYGLELRFTDPLAVDALMPLVEKRVGLSYRVLDWRLLSQGLFSGVETQRVVIGLFLFIIVVVSAFNLVASLIIVALRKTREIAVLGALGARPAAVLRIFVLAGAVTGLVGLTTGLAAGAGICALLRGYHFKLEAAVYMIAELPVDLDVGDMLVVAGMAQLASLLATVPSVIRARRLTVTDGLRQV
jgi:lipoprotein-releasing system permease protein